MPSVLTAMPSPAHLSFHSLELLFDRLLPLAWMVRRTAACARSAAASPIMIAIVAQMLESSLNELIPFLHVQEQSLDILQLRSASFQVLFKLPLD